jgi:hypothetical protein
MNPRIGEIWVYLAASPLLGLTLTLLAYQGAVMVSKRYDNHPLTNPVLLAITALVTLLWITGTPYRLYFDGAQFVHFLLGPATVALAIPLHAQFARLKRMALPVLAALLAGSLTASISAVVIGSRRRRRNLRPGRNPGSRRAGIRDGHRTASAPREPSRPANRPAPSPPWPWTSMAC